LTKSVFYTLTGCFTLSALFIHILMMPLLFAGVFYIVDSNYRNNFVNQVRNDALTLASISDSQNKNALLFQEKIIDDAITSGRLFAAKITGDEKKILREWGYPSLIKNMDEDFFFGEHDDSVFNIIIPRYNSAGSRQGELFLSYDELPTKKEISQAYLYGLYLSIIYIVITFFITIILGRRVTKPIKQLSNASKEISMGNYEKELVVESNIKDIQQLANTLEHMRFELVKKNNEMEHHAMHDGLTGLPNRLLLRNRIDEIISNNNTHTTALLMIDLDRFKEINDSLGHLVGDEVLKTASQRLLSYVRQSDTVSRLGGDEFAIILHQVSDEKAVEIANTLSKKLRESFTINGNELKVGASIGIALHPQHGKTFNEVLHCADIAMYASKSNRQGEAILYSEQLDKK